jgi:hypothetical protein
MCVYAYYTFIMFPVVSVETQIKCMYIYYTVVMAPSDPLNSNVDTSISCVLYIPSVLP